MSVEQAHALIKRLSEDPDFAKRLESTPIEQRRSVLEQEGYGDVKLRHLSQALPESAGGELSDDEFAAVAGTGATGTSIAATVVSANVTFLAGLAAAIA